MYSREKKKKITRVYWTIDSCKINVFESKKIYTCMENVFNIL